MPYYDKMITGSKRELTNIDIIEAHPNDVPIKKLNNLTLNEVFRDGNLITNNEFSDVLSSGTQWNISFSSVSIQNNSLRLDDEGNVDYFYTNPDIEEDTNKQYYVSLDVYNGSSNVRSIALARLGSTTATSINGQWVNLSSVI